MPVLELTERSIGYLAPQHRWPQPEDDDEPEPPNSNKSGNSKTNASLKSGISAMPEQVNGSLDLAEAWGLRARAVLALLRNEARGAGRAARNRRDRYLRAALDSLTHTLRIQAHVLLQNQNADIDVAGDRNNKVLTHSHPIVAETQVRADKCWSGILVRVQIFSSIQQYRRLRRPDKPRGEPGLECDF